MRNHVIFIAQFVHRQCNSLSFFGQWGVAPGWRPARPGRPGCGSQQDRRTGQTALLVLTRTLQEVISKSHVGCCVPRLLSFVRKSVMGDGMLVLFPTLVRTLVPYSPHAWWVQEVGTNTKLRPRCKNAVCVISYHKTRGYCYHSYQWEREPGCVYFQH